MQPDVRERLQVVTHTLLSRPNLEAVADKTGLSLRATTPADKDALLVTLGAAVKIRDAGTRGLYNLSYADSDRDMAQKVVQAFLQILMNDTVGANTASTTTAQGFLDQQVQDYGKRLTAAEKQLADFQKAKLATSPARAAAAISRACRPPRRSCRPCKPNTTPPSPAARPRNSRCAPWRPAPSPGIDPRTREVEQANCRLSAATQHAVAELHR